MLDREAGELAVLSRRSAIFEEYLRQQTPERRAALTAAEKRYAVAHSAQLASYEETFRELMQGYEETPAGSQVRSDPGLAAYLRALESGDNNGDWSWKPLRDKALSDSFHTFLGVPPSAAELYGRL